MPHLRWSYVTVATMLLAWTVLPAGAQYFRFGKNKVQYDQETWYYVQSEHFNVYYYEGGEKLADFTARAAEQAYARISDLFQYDISDRVPLLAYQSHNDFTVTNAVDLPTYSEGIGGVTELFKNRIAIPFTGDYRDFRRVIHHELVHAVLNDMFYGGSFQAIIRNNIQVQLPAWFNEGLAEYAALGWDTQSDMYLRDAVLEDKLPPVEQLDGFLAYRGGQGFWDYIAEQYGEEKIGEILHRLRTNRSIRSAFKRSTGLTLSALSERWHRALREIYFPELAARENLNDLARPLITRKDGFYNTSPALSPRGDLLAFVTTRSGLFDVYLADTNTGVVLQRLIAGQTSTSFESLRILTPGISWSPDGDKIALAVKSGAHDVIAVMDVRTRKTMKYRLPGVDQILTVAWSPDGERIAAEASKDAQSDIYVLDLTMRTVTNYTNDRFSDHEPAWSPNGEALVFHSDRGDHLTLGPTAGFRMIDQDYSQYDLYLLTLGKPRLRRLTATPLWDDFHAHFGADPDLVLYVSDRNGVYDLYAKNLETGNERPLTDLTIGVMQIALSADGQKAALVRLEKGTPSIYILKKPFDRTLDRPVLSPNVWAQRALPSTPQPAPALAVARPATVQHNPFMRDASDHVAYARDRTIPPPVLAQPSLASLHTGTVPFASSLPATDTGFSDVEESDTLHTGGVSIDFQKYAFSNTFEKARQARLGERYGSNTGHENEERFRPEDNLDAEGNFKPKKYKLNFSPDLVYGTAGYDVLYGVQGVTQMMFSDMLGNHRIVVATNLLIDLRNSDYILSYQYLPRRTDWVFTGFHTSRLLPDFQRTNPTYFRYRQYGAGLKASYPLDKFRRLDVNASVVGISQTDITDATAPSLTRALFYPTLTFTRDVTHPGYLSPSGGTRFALSVSGVPFSFNRQQIRFVSVLTDARAYSSFGRGRYVLSLRASGGASFGPNQQLFYTSGVMNWINRDFDRVNGFPIEDITDFVFATPVLPLRGYDINSRNGSYFGLINTEFHFPLVSALLPGPIPVLPLYNIQGVLFSDVGAIWGGRGLDKRFNLLRDDANGNRVLGDLLVGSGFGLRSFFLGYPIRLDFAWPYDGRRFGDRKIYFSVGFDI